WPRALPRQLSRSPNRSSNKFPLASALPLKQKPRPDGPGLFLVGDLDGSSAAAAPDRLDGKRRHARLLADRLVLLHDRRQRRSVAIQPTQQICSHLAVGALGAILVDDVEVHEF